MPRPESNRKVHEPPLFNSFKPIGARGRDLDGILLTLDEYEAIRLADELGYSHEEAAEEMEISRPTFSRLIERARQKVAVFLTKGGVLTIEGGNVHFRFNIIRCRQCGHMFKTSFKEEVKECPACHSSDLINLAGGFGHGRCCNVE